MSSATRTLLVFCCPWWKLRDGLLELGRDEGDKWHESLGMDRPRCLTLRCRDIETAWLTDGSPAVDPCVTLHVPDWQVCLMFVRWSGLHGEALVGTERQAAETAARDFYAQLVREMGRGRG